MSLKFFTEDGLRGVYNEDRSEAMDWDEKFGNPYRTQTPTSLYKWRKHQLIYKPGANDPEKVDLSWQNWKATLFAQERPTTFFE